MLDGHGSDGKEGMKNRLQIRRGSAAGSGEAALVAKAVAGICFFLAEVYRREPTAKLLKQFAGPGMAAALRDCAIDPDLAPGEAMSGIPGQLAEEYARLFVVPGPARAAPYESVYPKSGEAGLYGPEAVDVKKFIKMLRLRFKDKSLLPDHVSVELEVVGRLADMEGEACSHNNVDKAVECRQARGMFLKKHLARWFPLFAESVERSAHMPFYRQITAFAATFIAKQSRECAREVVGSRHGSGRQTTKRRRKPAAAVFIGKEKL